MAMPAYIGGGEPIELSVYDEMHEAAAQGKDVLDPNDWCYPAKKRVVSGSDGLWVRFGPKPDKNSWAATFFAIQFNPVVSGGAVFLLFTLVVVCAGFQPGEYCWTLLPANTPLGSTGEVAGCTPLYGAPTEERLFKRICYVPNQEFRYWMVWVADCWSWFYILTQDVWIIFLVVVYTSKYGSMKLGRDNDEPEFSNFSWFSMIFTCGVATGLFFYAASEPVYHYNPGFSSGNRFQMVSPTDPLNANRRAQEAMNLVWYHWGLHGWVCYCIMGLLLALLHFRKGLPMTVKSCFYPLIGERIYGFAGDFLDIVSTVATTMGVCTSLGLGVMQIGSGLSRLNGGQNWLGKSFYNKWNWPDWKEDAPDLLELWKSYPTSVQASHPWIDCAQVSVSNARVAQGQAALPSDDLIHRDSAAFVANLVSQNNSYILTVWIITCGSTLSVMCGLNYGIKTLANLCLALGMFFMFYILVMDDTWYLMNLFVQSCGFYIQYLVQLGFHTGAFSQANHGAPDGVGEFQSWMFWWTIFYWGWWIAWSPFVGIFMARISRGRTVKEFIFGCLVLPVLYNCLFMTIVGGAALKMEMSAEKYGVTCNMPQVVDGAQLHPYARNICRPVPQQHSPYTGEREMFCSTIFKLSCGGGFSGQIFDLLLQYSDMGRFMVITVLVSLTLYFVASSDSGSMVDDMVTANGIPEPPLAQRFFWAMTEGAAATGLIYSSRFTGSNTAVLHALQYMSICVGLPYTFLICFMCLALWRALQYEAKDRAWSNRFQWSVLDLGVQVYQCGEGKDRCFNMQRGWVDAAHIGKCCALIFVPWMSMMPAAIQLDERKKKGGNRTLAIAQVVGATVCFYLLFLFALCDYAEVDRAPYEWGSIMANSTLARLGGGNTISYTSTRYGYFREWAADPEIENRTIQYTWDVRAEHGEIALTNRTVADGLVTPYLRGVGDRKGRNLRVETIGWFFFFLFATILANLRFDARATLGIPGTIIEDFVVSVFFYPTVLYQLEAQMKIGAPAIPEYEMQTLLIKPAMDVPEVVDKTLLVIVDVPSQSKAEERMDI